MFSENDKISIRQLQALLILDLFEQRLSHYPDKQPFQQEMTVGLPYYWAVVLWYCLRYFLQH